MRVRKTHSIRVGLMLSVLIVADGCSIRVQPRNNGEPDEPAAIFITLVNDTETALDPQLFVAPVADGLGDLYLDSNQRTDFGLGMRGLIEPGKSATISTPCDPAVFIATQGGLFGADLDNPTGQGPEIVLEQDRNVRCGDHIKFTFSAAGSALQTSYTVEPQ